MPFKVKVEIWGEVSRDVKDCQKPSEARKKGGTDSPSQASKGATLLIS